MKIIDCDVHIRWKSLDEIAPYLNDAQRTLLKAGQPLYPASLYKNPGGVHRRDAYPPGGGAPGSDPQFTLQDLVERFKMDYAILIGEAPHLAVSNLADADWAGALASAYNNWIIDTWLAADRRFLGSIIVAAQDPARAAREIDRVAEHPQFVQVSLGSSARFPYGQQFYYPIYAAAERHNLPVAIHIGTEGLGVGNPPTGTGYPSHYVEWHTNLNNNFQPHLVSLICEGVFELYPRLKVVFVEGGIGWLPVALWRLDKNWRALRRDVPWVKRKPSDYALDHVRLTTQPLEEPDNPQHLAQLLNMFPAERMLLFSSDYPHWDFDNPTHILSHLPSDLRQRIFVENARELYGL